MSYTTQNIRNVVLLGHSGIGKTTFAETMLFESKATSRRGSIDEKNTVSDFTNIEMERGNSIFTTLMHATWKDSKINILDTPGFDDFVGEIVSSLKVADTGVMLLNAKNGVEVGSEIIWEYIQDYQTPAIIVINKMDHEKADFETSLEQAQNRFGSKVLPVQFPINAGNGFNTIVDALRMTMYVFPPDGGKPQKQDIPESAMSRAQEMHNQLVEAAAENDETLMEKFFNAGSLNEDELAKGLRIALAKQEIFPVFCCSAIDNMGSGRIMGFINDICPSPAERPPAKLADGGELTCDVNEDTSMFIYKTLSEPRIGNVTYFKIFSGKLKPGDEMINADTRNSERISQIYEANGKIRKVVSELCAGDIGVVLKIKEAKTNQTLNSKNSDRKIAPMVFPSARIRVAVNPPSKHDMEKLMKALYQIADEDPTLIIDQNKELKQTLLLGQGQLHLDITKYRIEKVNNIVMEFERPRISYRETITRTANDHYRHKKQSGGSGQFAEVHMRVEPWYEGIADPTDLNIRKRELEELPWGGKFEFLWCIVGGAIDAKYINAIKKGVLQKMEEGPLTGSYCQNIRICVYDGKMHPVDSNDMAFMLASSAVFKNAFQNAGPHLLEPVYELEILCADDVMGDVMGDLQTRRAMIMGMEAEGHYQKIVAKVPLKELYKYSASLRSHTQGKAKFNRKFLEYMAVTQDIQHKLTRTYETTLQEA